MSLISRYLSSDLPPGQSCFLWGTRKTGKSSYLRNKFPQAFFIDLLDSQIFQQYQKYPHQLEEEIRASPNKNIIIIDEVQKIPVLLDEIHRLIELYKEDKQFILCASSAGA